MQASLLKMIAVNNVQILELILILRFKAEFP